MGALLEPSTGTRLLATAEHSLRDSARLHPNAGTAGWVDVTAHQRFSPEARQMSAMAYDPTLRAVVLFGGYYLESAFGDTWLFKNGTWTQWASNNSTSPAPRWEEGLTWDSADGYLLLFGGRDDSGFFNDTWAFTHDHWVSIATSSAPSPRGFVQMTDDPADGYVLLYGGAMGNVPVGSDSNWTDYSDTWAFRAGAWTHLAVHGSPGSLDNGGLVYDPANRSMPTLMYGGVRMQTTSLSGCDAISSAYSFQGGNWTNLSFNGSAGTPPRLAAFGMVYDANTSELIVLGGVEVSGSACDVVGGMITISSSGWHTFNGTTPSPRNNLAIAFDPAMNATVVFGGADNDRGTYLGDTWLYGVGLGNLSGPGGGNGSGSLNLTTGWNDLTTGLTNAPSTRDMAAMAYDPGLAAVILFGGYSPLVFAYGDTWLFQNYTWTDLSPQLLNSPPARWGAGLVWDAADGYFLLFGGRNTTQFFNDTWKFSGSNWIQINTTTAPSPRAFFGMTFETNDSTVLLYGGGEGNVPARSYSPWSVYSDTWSFQNGTWTNLTGSVTGAPGPRVSARLTDDPLTGGAVLFGGQPTQTSNPGRSAPAVPYVYAYSSGRWTNRSTSGNATLPPFPTSSFGMDWAVPDHAAFLFGGVAQSGAGSTPNNATIEYSGGSWAQLPSAPSPPALNDLALSFDPTLCAMVLFGGANNARGSYSDSTWVYLFANTTACGGAIGSEPRSPPPALSASESVTVGVAPLEVQFVAVAFHAPTSSVLGYYFGDGATAGGSGRLAHLYSSPGTYTPIVVLTNGQGVYVSARLPTIQVGPPSARSGPSPPAASHPVSAPALLGSALAGVAAGSLAAAAAIVAWRRRRERREGDELIHALGFDGSPPDAPPPPDGR